MEIDRNARYKATLVQAAEDAVVAAEAKVAKLKAHLAGAIDGVEAAEAELARVQATDYVWEESHESVVVGLGAAEGGA